MTAIFGSAAGSFALPALLDAAAKVSLLLALAFVVAAILRRAPASARHLVWLVALACALALPVCAGLLPGWRALPEWMSWETIHAAASRSQHGTDGTDATHLFPPAASTPFVASVPSVPSIAKPAPQILRISASALLAIWAAGAGLLLAPLACSVFALRRISRRTRPLDDARLAAHIARIARELGLRRRVRVLIGDADAMPMVWGIFRASLLLPASAADWTDARLRGVLLHEFAHLHRRDPLALFIAQLALALHWFNPLAWFAVRRMRAEQERACDDFVLRHGVRASQYAADLLEVSTGFHATHFAAAALSMAHPERLEGRIDGILDAARNRSTLSRWLIGATFVFTALLALPLAMLRAGEGKVSPDRELTGVFLVANAASRERVSLPLRIPGKAEATVEIESKPVLATKDFERFTIEPAKGGRFTLSVALDKNGRKKYSAACERNLGREHVWVVDGIARTRSPLGYAAPGGSYGVDLAENTAEAKVLQTNLDAALAANPPPQRAHPALTAAEWDAKPAAAAAQTAYDTFILSQLENGWVHATALHFLHGALVEILAKSPANADALHPFRRRLETDEWWKPAEVAAFLDEVAAQSAEALVIAAGQAAWDHSKNGRPKRPKPSAAIGDESGAQIARIPRAEYFLVAALDQPGVPKPSHKAEKPKKAAPAPEGVSSN